MLRLYRKPSKGLIGVDISSTSVKVLELSVKNNRYWVESYALVPLPEGSVVEKNILNPEAVGDALEREFTGDVSEDLRALSADVGEL